jgi:hypothetical protein
MFYVYLICELLEIFSRRCCCLYYLDRYCSHKCSNYKFIACRLQLSNGASPSSYSNAISYSLKWFSCWRRQCDILHVFFCVWSNKRLQTTGYAVFRVHWQDPSQHSRRDGSRTRSRIGYPRATRICHAAPALTSRAFQGTTDSDEWSYRRFWIIAQRLGRSNGRIINLVMYSQFCWGAAEPIRDRNGLRIPYRSCVLYTRVIGRNK